MIAGIVALFGRSFCQGGAALKRQGEGWLPWRMMLSYSSDSHVVGPLF